MNAIFPGSFDPFTLGHLDVIRQGLNVFDKIVIGIGYNPNKSGHFSFEKRLEIIHDSIKELDCEDRVEVVKYEGLTSELCKRLDIFQIIRGVRTTMDFENECIIAEANKKMDSRIQTVFVPASAEYSYLSSSVVREVLFCGGDTSLFLSKNVKL